MSEVDPRDASQLYRTVASGSGIQVGNDNLQINLIQPATAKGARTAISRTADEELSKLADWGLMRVPWIEVGDGRREGAALTEHNDLADLVVGGGHLIILGDRRSGKTTLAARLSQLITARRDDRQAILFRLSVWPRGMPLFQWFSQVLDESGIPASEHGQTLSDLSSGRIIAIFDGFDEIPPVWQADAAEKLRRFTSGRSAVLTCRTAGDQLPLHHALPRARVVELRPVDPEEVGRYLLDGITGLVADPWEQLAAELKSDRSQPLRIALSSPLFAWLVKTVYASPGQAADPVTALVNRFQTAAEIEECLLRQLVPAVFRSRATDPTGKGSTGEAVFSPEEATHWLGFLSYRAANQAVAFWEIRTYAPLYRLGLTAALLLGIVAGLLGSIGPIPPSIYCEFLLAGVFFGFGYARGYSDGRWRARDDPARLGYLFAKENAAKQRETTDEPSRPDTPKDGSWRSQSVRLVKGFSMVVVAYGVAVAIWFSGHSVNAWQLGLTNLQLLTMTVTASAFAAMLAYIGGRITVPVLTRFFPAVNANVGARTPDPITVIQNDRKSGVGMAVLASLVMPTGYAVYSSIWHPPAALWGTLAAPIAVSAALIFWNEWSAFVVAHTWLVLLGRLRRPIAAFLAACHDGGILYKRGNHFIFRHQRLQACLADIYRERESS